jgi:hypothetical protein
MASDMSRVHSSRLQAGIVLASVFMISLQAHATTLLKKNLDDLVVEADAIVVGTVTDVQAEYTADKSIRTLVTVSDLRVVHGSYQDPSLTLQLPGGQIENDVLDVQGSPRLGKKDRVLLFIQGNGRQIVPFVGWTQGVFRIERDAKSGKQKIKDHDRNPVLEVQGSELIKDQLYASEATIVAEPGKSQAAGGNGGQSDDSSASSAAAPKRVASSSKEAIDADAFIREVVRKVREKHAKGKAIQSVGSVHAADVDLGQDAPAPER